MKRGMTPSFTLPAIMALLFISSCNLFGPTGAGDPGDPATSDTTAPAEVTSLSAAQGAGGIVILGWTNPGDSDFSGVEITWNNGGTAPVPLASGITSYTTAALSDGLGYTFTVKAVDATGNKSAGATAVATADATPPPEVSILASCGAWVDEDSDGDDDYFDLDEAHEEYNQLRVTWDSPAQGTTDHAGVLASWTGASGATYTEDYPVYVNGNYQTQRECLVFDVLPETTYEFRLRAYDAAGNISEGIRVSGTTEYGWTEYLVVQPVADPAPDTLTSVDYSSFAVGGTDYPMYSQPTAEPAAAFDASYPNSPNAQTAHPSICIPAGSRLLIGAQNPEDAGTAGHFDLSNHFWFRVFIYAEGSDQDAQDDPRPTGNVYVYLNYNGSSPDGTQTSCILRRTADAIEYDTDGGMLRYYYGGAKDLDGASGDIFPNGVPAGTASSYFTIYNESNIDIYFFELRIQG